MELDYCLKTERIYEPLAWLLRDDRENGKSRRSRRVLYRKLVRELSAEFDAIYGERLTASNGPWDFPEVYIASQQARKCVWRMHRCAFEHMLHMPGACARSLDAYRSVMELLNAAG